MQRNKIAASGALAATVLITGLALTTSNAEAAAKRGGPGKGALTGKARTSGDGRMLEKYAGQLGLTSDQKTRIRQVMESVKTERERVKNNASLTPEARRTQAKAIARNASAQIKAILTPAQEAKVKELRQAARERRRATASAKRTTTPPRGGILKG